MNTVKSQVKVVLCKHHYLWLESRLLKIYEAQLTLAYTYRDVEGVLGSTAIHRQDPSVLRAQPRPIDRDSTNKAPKEVQDLLRMKVNREIFLRLLMCAVVFNFRLDRQMWSNG